MRTFESYQRFGVIEEPRDNIGDSVERERRRKKEKRKRRRRKRKRRNGCFAGIERRSISGVQERGRLENLQTSSARSGGGGEFGSATTVAAVPHVVTPVRGGRPFVPFIFGGFTFQKSFDIQEYLFLHHHPHHIILFLIILTMSVSSLGCLLKLLLCRWREDLADNLQH